MQSPQVMNIWASGKEQSTRQSCPERTGGDDGEDNSVWVCLSRPIRSYQQRLRDPEPQDAVPRPTAQTMEESDSTGSFELVQQDEGAPAITRLRREEGQHQAMPGGSAAASSASPREEASQKGSKRKSEKQETKTEVKKDDRAEAVTKRFQGLEPPKERDLSTDGLMSRFLRLEPPSTMKRSGKKGPDSKKVPDGKKAPDGKPRSKAKAAQTMRQDEQPQDEEAHPLERVCRKEGTHQAMASYGGSSGSGGRDGGRDGGDRRVPHHFDDPVDDAADADAWKKRKPGWLMRRGKSTKKNEENEERWAVSCTVPKAPT